MDWCWIRILGRRWVQPCWTNWATALDLELIRSARVWAVIANSGGQIAIWTRCFVDPRWQLVYVQEVIQLSSEVGELTRLICFLMLSNLFLAIMAKIIPNQASFEPWTSGWEWMTPLTDRSCFEAGTWAKECRIGPSMLTLLRVSIHFIRNSSDRILWCLTSSLIFRVISPASSSTTAQ